MKNKIQNFTLFVRQDEKSRSIAENIRELNLCSDNPLKEVKDGDLIIAIGGDGTFIDAVTSTNFSPKKIYAGIHTGTLGFLQNLSSEEIYTLIKYLHYEKEIKTRKVYIPLINVELKDGKKLTYNALNEVLIAGKHCSKIFFEEHVNGELLQKVYATGICIASNTGDTAMSMNSGGSIDFSGNFQLTGTLILPIKNAAYQRFIRNSIICSDFEIILEESDNIEIIIDGNLKVIPSELIEKVCVSMEGSNFINKFELEKFSKAKIIREKILGYTD